jgi:hypothetical protein
MSHRGHDVAHNFDLAGPAAFERFPSWFLSALDGCNRPAALGNSDRAAVLVNVVEHGQALGFELGGAHDPVLHTAIIPKWSDDQVTCSGQKRFGISAAAQYAKYKDITVIQAIENDILPDGEAAKTGT